MRTALTLMALSFTAALFASGQPHTSLLWVALAWSTVALTVAAVLRVHAVVNASGAER